MPKENPKVIKEI